MKIVLTSDAKNLAFAGSNLMATVNVLNTVFNIIKTSFFSTETATTQILLPQRETVSDFINIKTER